MWGGCTTVTRGDCSPARCGKCTDTKAVKDMFGGSKRHGGTVSEMERECGTISSGVAVRVVGTQTRDRVIEFRCRIV